LGFVYVFVVVAVVGGGGVDIVISSLPIEMQSFK
jgi:hypothetical protein